MSRWTSHRPAHDAICSLTEKQIGESVETIGALPTKRLEMSEGRPECGDTEQWQAS